MAITRTDRDQVIGPNGQILSERVVVRDITIEVNRSDLVTKAQAALQVNATFLALPSPSNAQILAQVRTLTRENNGLIRLLLYLLNVSGVLDSTDNT